MHFGVLKAFVIVTFVAYTFTSISANDVVSSDIKTRPSRRLGVFSGISKFFGMSGDDAGKAATNVQGKASSKELVTSMRAIYKTDEELKEGLGKLLKFSPRKKRILRHVAAALGLSILGGLALYGANELPIGTEGPP
ncbi:uncharacterized protein PHALS_07487 [Plasmopara halstedii]|uniref:Uncharacterized protein n=1 Tax=Plasmopara halstedii TaxID=4781 RepID=A0A0P1B5L8_PLAHL|nr:uncharacterized protein PHALS_07487 [Plasmopara halstedii]CEG49737.1 hypothetical protein PHALS_07487 [Plasmopara halstedii]|eukprot:XP_024586106.1 hypothetical protein PHALS_07487 [Plasmopara halstedii]